ncbi:hypothetical protein CKO11_11090 [Rhodobacter sp. TJ_12]|uniref:Hint domain-containing protein n=1 Tax=Rhodobacter sp. TJ_12 TaxID=2029399 RepID=UPI001CBB976D|nr:Hint domain-containing protein [Rhodobacter sp. TJ_12]MBZ4023004.1 hypothetical protein [Rhodobacter sp. TJ_12]
MAIYALEIFDIADASTTAAGGFVDNGGYQFTWNVDTITLTPGASTTTLSITDYTDATFDDDGGGGQILNGAQTINGTTWPDGTNIEAEYIVHLEDILGNPYTLQFVSLDNDAYNIQGFVVQGPLPPFGEPLTVVSTQDLVTGTYSYASSAPSCFAAESRIATPLGAVPAGLLRRGQQVCLADGGSAEVALVLRSSIRPAGAPRRMPVSFAPDALGPGWPARRLILSRQHRVALPEAKALIAAHLLLDRPGVRLCPEITQIDYVHIVLARHAVVLAEGLGCESFWPGPVALAGLPTALAARVRAIMGPAPQPALPFLGRKAYARSLRHLAV